MKISKQVWGYAFAVTAALIWGSNAVLIRFLAIELDTNLIAVSRAMIGGLVLLLAIGILALFARSKYNWRKFNSVRYDFFFWMMTISLAINFVMFHKGLDYTSASDTALIETFAPVFTLLLIVLFLPSKLPFLKTNTNFVVRLIFIVVIGSVGSSILLINEPGDALINRDEKTLGDIIQFIAMLLFACFCLANNEYKKRHPKLDGLIVTTHMLLFVGLFLLPFLFFTFDFQVLTEISSNTWMWLAATGIFATGASYLLWYTASKHLFVTTLTLIFNLTAVVTVITEYFVFGTLITWQIVLATILIIISAVIAELTYQEASLGKKHVKSLTNAGIKD